MRYFLLDKVTAIEPGRSASGVKCITLTDEVLHDHFPDHPIMPGTLIAEGLAQLAGLLIEATVNRGEGRPLLRAMLAQIDKLKLYKSCGPGECLALQADIAALRDSAAQVDVQARVADARAVRGKLTFALLAIDSERLHAQRRELYRLWTRELDDCPPLR